jgi:RNA polymerase sigma factor (sigma-70 family)
MQLRDPQAFPLWFHRILTRAILDRASRSKRLREAPLDAADELTEDWQRNAPRQPDELALEGERRERLWRRVLRLEPRARLAIALRYYGDCSPREVAEALGIRDGAARTLLSRALARLRQLDTEPEGGARSAALHDDPFTHGADALERITASHAYFDTK